MIEDFHYLDQAERQKFAFDLKAMWDLGLYVVVVGVWSDNNLLFNLNSDLTGRVREVSGRLDGAGSTQDPRPGVRGAERLHVP